MEPGLSRVKAVLQRANLLTPSFTVFTIGGTNGKGSSAYLLECALRHKGLQTGLYSSPHLVSVTERFQLNGAAVSHAKLIEVFNAVEQLRADIRLTYFEILTVAALWLFQDAGVDAAVLEVGLGGRLDAVNAVEPNAVLVTNIALDHQDRLGPDIESIAAEKAALYRVDKPAIFGGSSVPQAMQDLPLSLSIAGRDYAFETGEAVWQYRSKQRKLAALPMPAAGIALANLAAVITLIDEWQPDFLDRHAIEHLCHSPALPGRFQRLPAAADGVALILDVAHNPAACEELKRKLLQLQSANDKKAAQSTLTRYAVCGMLADKDAAACVAVLSDLVDVWLLTSLDGPRGLSAEALAGKLLKQSISAQQALQAPKLVEHSSAKQTSLNIQGHYASPLAALSAAEALAQPGDEILVFGSFVTVTAVLRERGDLR